MTGDRAADGCLLHFGENCRHFHALVAARGRVGRVPDPAPSQS